MTLGAYASFFEVQVPMSERTSVYGVKSTALGERTSLTDGHFRTSVQPVDGFGHAYSPGQSSDGNSYTPGGPRRVLGEDEDDPRETEDPLWGNVAPIGPTPYILFVLLLAAYAVIKRRRRS